MGWQQEGDESFWDLKNGHEMYRQCVSLVC
jgi:hypothetical protein